MKKWICSLLLIILLSSLAACGKSQEPDVNSEQEKAPPEIQNYKEGVVDAAGMIVRNGAALWAYDEQLCSALLDDNGDLYDFVSEGNLAAKISSVAADGNTLYLSTDAGIVRMPLTDMEQKQSKGILLDDHDISGHSFQIYGDNIYFTYGYSLYSLPKDGGERKKMDSDVTEFQVTTEGVYCLNKNGDLIRVSLDGKERQTLYELGSGGDICVSFDTLYITTGEDKDYIYVYKPETDEIEKLHFEKDLSPYHPVWATEDSIYYESEDYEIFQYDLASQTETPCAISYSLPDYHDGCLSDGVLYYVYSDSIYWMHLDTALSYRYAKSDLLKNGAAGSFSTPGTGSGNSSAASANSGSSSAPDTDSGSYNIAENIGVYSSEGQARLESKYFTLYLPSDGNWDYEVIDSTAIGIYYTPARDSGYGGRLVTIAAYDWGDNSYEDNPSYTIAGLGEDKKYIALFPTDVQYDSSHADGYNYLFQYVQRIDNSEEHAADNPFFCQ